MSLAQGVAREVVKKSLLFQVEEEEASDGKCDNSNKLMTTLSSQQHAHLLPN